MKIEINATSRSTQGKGASRRLRRAGRVPGILYGADKQPAMIELDHNELFHKIKLEAFHSSILTLNFEGQQQQVLLRASHWHPFKTQVDHVDFQRVAADRKIHMKIPLHFVNADIAPGVKVTGGIVNHVMNEVDVTCLPADLPEFIEVDLANLQAGHSLHLADLKAPTGVQFSQLIRNDNAAVATIVIPKVATEEEETAAAAAAPAAAEVPTTVQKEKDAAAAADEKDKGGKDKEKKK